MFVPDYEGSVLGHIRFQNSSNMRDSSSSKVFKLIEATA